MDTDRTATHFNAIDNHIVRIRTNGSRIAIQQRDIFGFGRRERVMHSIETLVFFAPLEQREVDHPQASKLVLVAQSQLAGHFQTQFAKLFAGLHRIVTRKDQDQVARLSTEGFLHLLQDFLRIELIYA